MRLRVRPYELPNRLLVQVHIINLHIIVSDCLASGSRQPDNRIEIVISRYLWRFQGGRAGSNRVKRIFLTTALSLDSALMRFLKCSLQVHAIHIGAKSKAKAGYMCSTACTSNLFQWFCIYRKKNYFSMIFVSGNSTCLCIIACTIVDSLQQITRKIDRYIIELNAYYIIPYWVT